MKPNGKTTECPKESNEPESSQTITDSDDFVKIEEAFAKKPRKRETKAKEK